MASPIAATLILCDAAQADPFGKLHILGAGWQITTSPTAPSAVAVILRIPWDLTNKKLDVHLRMLTEDGGPVAIPDPVTGEPQPVGMQSMVEVGRPPGVPEGSLIPTSFVLSLASLPLPPGRYEWRLTVNQNDFSESFMVR